MRWDRSLNALRVWAQVRLQVVARWSSMAKGEVDVDVVAERWRWREPRVEAGRGEALLRRRRESRCFWRRSMAAAAEGSPSAGVVVIPQITFNENIIHRGNLLIIR